MNNLLEAPEIQEAPKLKCVSVNRDNIAKPVAPQTSFTDNKALRNTIILIALTFVARILIAAFTGLGIGESYYFRGAITPSMSYFDQPPLFFWLSSFMIKIFGLSNL